MLAYHEILTDIHKLRVNKKQETINYREPLVVFVNKALPAINISYQID